QQERNRVAALLTKHQAPTDKLILKELKEITKQLLHEEAPEQATAQLDNLVKTYDSVLFGTIINRPAYVQSLTQALEKANVPQLQHVWQSLGRYLSPSAVSQGLLQISLRKVGHLLEQRHTDEVEDLLTAMKQAMTGHEQEWLSLAVDIYIGPPDLALKRFYYYLVYELSLEQRAPYRKLVPSTRDDLIAYEIKCDLHTAGPQRGLPTIEQWAEHARNNQYALPSVATYAIQQLQKICSGQQWHELAPHILKSSSLAPLLAKVEDELVQELM